MHHLAPTRSILAGTPLALLLIALAAANCSLGGRGDDDTAGEVSVSADQEERMCPALGSSTYKPRSAGPSKDSCDAIDAQAGCKQIALADFEGKKGGYLELAMEPSAETPVFLLIDAPVPFRVERADGTQADFLESGKSSELCQAAGGRYLWIVDQATNYLVFGPTDEEIVNITLETVDGEDTAP
ncbi:MAG: hypothetical protein PHU25_05150 [Deltaproteobacteria bacterium]|nr:hypothetical protein [Deltaproteobacteria bacterium]